MYQTTHHPAVAYPNMLEKKEAQRRTLSSLIERYVELNGSNAIRIVPAQPFRRRYR